MPKDVAESDSDSDSDWNEELINAVRKKEGKSETITEEDRIKRIVECLDEGAEVDAVDKQNNTVLHIAIKKEYIKIVQFLVKQEAKINIPNRKGQTALSLAEATGNADILNALKGLVNDPSSQLPSQQTAFTSQTTSSSNKRASASAGNHTVVKDSRKSLKREATADNEDNDNGKRRRLDTAEEEEEEISLEEDSESEDGIVDDEIDIGRHRSQFAGDNRYSASGLKHTLHGNVYQLKLLMLFLNRGLREGYSFRLSTEMDAAEKFDDLVFQYENQTGTGTAYRFLQAKHKQDETKTISTRDLLTENDDEFSLQKYFISYRQIKKHSELSRSAFEDFILCTNIDFDFEGLKSANICLEKVDKPDAFLDIKNVVKQPARYKFRVDDQSELHKILKRTADVYRLAKILVEHVCESKNITLKNELFKLYHTALAEEVIDIKNKQFSVNFIKGENLSERAKNFREIFCAEATIHLTKSLGIYTSEKTAWEEITKNPLKISPSFGQQFELSIDPKLNPLTEFSEELFKLIKSADNDNLVMVDGKKYRKNAKAASREKIFVDNIDKLAGHVLILETEKIKFRSQFFDDSIIPPGNIGGLKNLLKVQLGSKYNDLHRYQFKMTNFKTCEEEQLESKTELPGDDIDDKEIDEFFDKLIFAVNQPNEIELGNIITREIAADSQFNLLNADLVGDSFQKEMLDWFKEKGKEKGKEGRFYSTKDGQAFYDSVEQKINTLVSSGFSLSYPEELEGYGMEFAEENEELRDFLIRDSDPGAKPVLNLIAAQETLLTSIRVHRAIQRTGKYKENDSLMFLRLRTLLLPGIKRRVIRAFESPNSHHLLVIDCGSAKKQALQGLYSRLCQSMRKNVGKKLILVTQRPESSANRSSFHLKNCHKIYDDVRFEDLTTESRYQLIRKQVINFQGRREPTSFERLLGISGSVDTETEQLMNFGGLIDTTSTLVNLIRNEEIKVGSELQGLGEVENYYVDRTIDRQVIIKNDILKSESKSDLFAVSAANSESSISLITGGRGIPFNDIEPQCKESKECIILDPELEAEQFKTLCVNSVHNIHWLKIIGKKLIWQQSQGKITTLVKYRDVDDIDKTTASTLTEDELIDHPGGQRVVIISESAGMGKTTVFTHLARKMKEKPGLWVIRIDLNDFTAALHKELTNPSFDGSDTNGAVDFFTQKLSKLETDLEKKLLKMMIENRGEVALLFDGFDEISPEYTNTVIDLLQALDKIGVAKLFVATRPHMRGILENKLGTFSHTMEPFSEENQTDFLVRFWKAGLGLNGIEQRLKTYAESLIKNVVKSINETAKDLASIPLQLRMIAEVFQDGREGEVQGKGGSESCEEFLRSDNDEPKLRGKLNTVDLYRSFIDKKYRIYSVEKKKNDPTNLGVREDGEALREIFLKRHEKLALHTLFDAEGFLEFNGPRVLPLLLNNQEIKGVEAYLTEIIQGRERTGIITQVVNGKSQFIHRTFAEYFVAIFIINTLLTQADHNPNVRKFIVKQILLDSESKYKVIRNFLNGLLLQALPDSDSSANEAWKSDLLECRGVYGHTIFHRAAHASHYETLKFFLNRFAEHDNTRRVLISIKDDNNGRAAVHIVADKQHWDEVRWLIDHGGAEVNSLTDTRRSPLHAAASCGDLGVVKWLVEKGADVNASDSSGATPLLEAAQSGSLAVLEWLADEKGVSLSDPNENGRTVLDCAASAGQLEVVKWLVNVKNVDLNSKMNAGGMALHAAAANGQWDVVKWLITEKNIDINSEVSNRGTILHVAASSGDLDTVKWLVDKDADVNAMSRNGDTVLNLAASKDRWVVCKWLIVEKGADITGKSWRGETVLHKAANRQRWSLVKWLVEHRGADLNAKDELGRTVLHEAAYSQRWDVVKWLSERKDNHLVHAYADGVVLCHAAAQQRWDDVRWLVEEKSANVNIGSAGGRTVLHLAAINEKWEIVKWLIEEKGADVNVQDCNGNSVLHYAASSGQFELVKWLVMERGADINARTGFHLTLLHCAAASGEVRLVKWLMEERGADPEAVNYRGETVLHQAALREHWDLVKWLVREMGANVEAKNNEYRTVLHIAASFQQWDVVRLLAESNAVDVKFESRNGNSVLLYAIESGDLDVIKWLVNDKGIDADAKFKNGRSVLYCAVASGHLEVVKWLVVGKGADPKTIDRKGKTLQHAAVATGHCEVLKWLVEEQAADVGARDKGGTTLLHEAAVAGNLDVIRLLVESYNVDVVAADADGDTALDLYCRNRGYRDEAIVRFLEQGDCNLESALKKEHLSIPHWASFFLVNQSKKQVNGSSSTNFSIPQIDRVTGRLKNQPEFSTDKVLRYLKMQAKAPPRS